MEYITTANVLAWVFLTLGIFLMFVGYWLAATALFPRHVGRCEVLFSRPVIVSLIGLLLAVIPIVAGFAILKAFPVALKWIGLVLIIVLVVGFMAFSKAGAAKKAQVEKESAQKIDSPYAAIANGKADVEGGVIKVAARRGGVVREVFVNEGDRVVTGQILAVDGGFTAHLPSVADMRPIIEGMKGAPGKWT
jgi:hypothetical protein